MPQQAIWEKEYRNSKLLHFHPEPQKDTVRFFKWQKKKTKANLEGKHILDLGSGTGRNANYCADKGAIVTGIEISPTAVSIAKKEAKKLGVSVAYILGSFGDKFPITDNSVDIVLDITSSNSLNEEERKVYLSEINRVLKPGGFIFVKTLSKEGDNNAKRLLKLSPGKEKDTYLMKELGLVERVFTREDLVSTYSPYFDILSLDRKESYTHMNGRKYKRQFWLLYAKKYEK